MKQYLHLLLIGFVLPSVVFCFEIEWELYLDYPGSMFDIYEKEDQHICLISQNNDNIHITEFDNNLEIQWSEHYEDQPIMRYLETTVINRHGNYTLVGSGISEQPDSPAWCFFEVDAHGDSLAYRMYSDRIYSRPINTIVAPNGNYLVLIGIVPPPYDDNRYEWWILEFDADFEIADEHFVHRPVNGMEITDFIQLDEGGYFVIGRDIINMSAARTVIKFDENCNFLWKKHYGNRYNALPIDIIKISNDKYGLYGTERHDRLYFNYINQEGEQFEDSLYYYWYDNWDKDLHEVICVKYGENDLLVHEYYWRLGDERRSVKVLTHYSPEFDTLHSQQWGREEFDRRAFRLLKTTEDGGVIIITERDYDDCMFKIAPPRGNPGSVKPKNQTNPFEYNLLAAYPNPFNSSVRIEFNHPLKQIRDIKIFDSVGRSINNQGLIPPGAGSGIIWRPIGLKSGTYFIIINDKSDSFVLPVQYLR